MDEGANKTAGGDTRRDFIRRVSVGTALAVSGGLTASSASAATSRSAGQAGRSGALGAASPGVAIRPATNVTLCDSQAVISGTAGAWAIDGSNPGLGSSSLRLSGPSTVKGNTQITVQLTNGPWSFGDGSNPSSYLRFWVMILDSRDVARSSMGGLQVWLATAKGFKNCVMREIGLASTGDVTPTKPKSELIMTPLEFPALQPDDPDLPPPPNAGSSAWQQVGQGLSATDWGAITQVQIRIVGRQPADGSPYVPPTAWLMGVEQVPLAPYPICTFQFDWSMPYQYTVGLELMQSYGVVPLLTTTLYPYRGDQGSTIMNLSQIQQAAAAGFEICPYLVEDGPQNGYPDAQDGRNNFGGGSNVVDGVPWSQLSTAQLASMYSEMQGYLSEYGLGAGVNLTMGQERKVRRDAAAFGTSSDGEQNLDGMAAGSHCPVAGSFISSWPPNDPYRRVSRMLDLHRDVVQNPDGSYSPSDAFQRYVNLAVKTNSWINLLSHAVVSDGAKTAGMPASALFALFDYVTAPGRFDGVTGKILSTSEALTLS